MSGAATLRPRAAAARPGGPALLGALALGLPAAMLLALSAGAIEAGPLEIATTLARGVGLPIDAALDPGAEAAILSIRLPRVLLGAVVGAALALAGAALQALFGNPLADPGLIGVSSGAAAAATAWIALGGSAAAAGLGGVHALPIVAFAGALGAVASLYALSRGLGRFDAGTLLLIGVAINAAAGVAIGAFAYLADDASLRSLVFWTMGSLASASWTLLAPAAALVAAGAALLLARAEALDVMALGEGDARALGIDVRRLTAAMLVGAALMTGAATAVAGVIGFVGLVAPHLVRLAGLVRARVLLPASALAGAILVTLSDLSARVAIAPAELPIGLVTGAIGAPLFLWMIARRARRLAA